MERGKKKISMKKIALVEKTRYIYMNTSFKDRERVCTGSIKERDRVCTGSDSDVHSVNPTIMTAQSLVQMKEHIFS